MKAVDLVSACDPIVRTAAMWLVGHGYGHETFVRSDGGYTTWQTGRASVFGDQRMVTRTVRPKQNGGVR